MSFEYTQMEAGEEILFGVTTSTSSSSTRDTVNGQVTNAQASAVERRIGITNRRVIIEFAGAPDVSTLIPNTEVRKVNVKAKDFAGDSTLTIESVEAAGGNTYTIGIWDTEPDAQARLKQAFPQAEIVMAGAGAASEKKKEKKKGLFGLFGG